ncbi:MBL fold metallo-hydrolase [Rhodococcus oxybenzonivorans]|uniref:MBL fold metallo-hydrolase n=1 Tax=Rhodococcus oxybenzonivorans TaxID=1990687 RepID=UPI00295545B1|nr:MBL fold metallo-hydrolase [Rhodococcus oxybenzonivorans]MDV7352742.1 MBL fold metallo-hydrolase [Rhodococcus oxybenzonivorans]
MAEPFREIAPGLFWLGDCLKFEYGAEIWHGHVSTYLILGEKRTLLLDTGHPAHWDAVEAALDELLGDRPLDLVLPTHPEMQMPHAGNLPHLARKYPELAVVGDTRDYHLHYPYLADRLTPTPIGDRIDLGGREIHVLPAIWRDLPNTVWAFDTGSRVMFVADGFSYSHHHLTGECRLYSSELPQAPGLEQTVFLNERALFWTRHVDSEHTEPDLESLFDRYKPVLVAPAHGSVIDTLDEMVELLKVGMAQSRRQNQRVEARWAPTDGTG